MQRQEIDCFIFYFDIIGVVDEYIKNPSVIQRIEKWQQAVLNHFSMSVQDTTCKTMFDNVWARITSHHPEADMYSVLDFAGQTMRLAKQFGFEKYFGAITYGTHSYDIMGRTIYGGANPTDIIKQHIDTLGPAHIRAGFAEKWSIALAKEKKHPLLNSVWVSEEVLFGIQDLHEVVTLSNVPHNYNVNKLNVDLSDPQYAIGKPWPFKESKFQFITA